MISMKLASRSTPSLFRLPLPFNKFIGVQRSTASTSPPAKQNTEPAWQPIFKFKHINFLVSLNKLKMYQIIGTAIAVPLSFTINEADSIASGFEGLPVVVSTIGITGLVTLSLASYALKGAVGFIYTSSTDPELVKFSYMDFWGVRRNVEMKIEDVVPFSEIPRSFFDRFYTTLRFHRRFGRFGQTKLKLIHKLGGIFDHTEFMRVFGSE